MPDSTHRTKEGPSIATMPILDLLEHLEVDYHARMKESILRIRILFDRMPLFGGLGQLDKLAGSFDAFRSALEEHLLKEERVIFPHLRRLATGLTGCDGPLGPIDRPLDLMENEHERAARLMSELRDQVGQLEPGEEGPRRMLLEELADLWERFVAYVEIENETLHPRARKLERDLRGGLSA